MVAERTEFSKENILARLTRAGDRAMEEATYILEESELSVGEKNDSIQLGYNGDVSQSVFSIRNATEQEKLYHDVIQNRSKSGLGVALASISKYLYPTENSDVVPVIKQDLSQLAAEISETHQKSLDATSEANQKMRTALNRAFESVDTNFAGTNFKDKWIDEAVALGLGAAAAVALAPVIVGTGAAVASASLLTGGAGAAVGGLAWGKTFGSIDFNAKGRMKTVDLIMKHANDKSIYVPENLISEFIQNYLDPDVMTGRLNLKLKKEAIDRALDDLAHTYPDLVRGVDAQRAIDNDEAQKGTQYTANRLERENDALEMELNQAQVDLTAMQDRLNDMMAKNPSDVVGIEAMRTAMNELKNKISNYENQIFTNQERGLGLNENIQGLNLKTFDAQQASFEKQKHNLGRNLLQAWGVPTTMQKLFPGTGFEKVINFGNMLSTLRHESRKMIFHNWDEYVNLDKQRLSVEFKMKLARQTRLEALNNLRGLNQKLSPQKTIIDEIQQKLAKKFASLSGLERTAELKYRDSQIANADIDHQQNRLALASEKLAPLADKKDTLEQRKKDIQADPKLANSVKTETIAAIDKELKAIEVELKAIQQEITQVKKDIAAAEANKRRADEDYDKAKEEARKEGLSITDEAENNIEGGKIANLKKELEAAVLIYNGLQLQIAESQQKVQDTETLITQYREQFTDTMLKAQKNMILSRPVRDFCAADKIKYVKDFKWSTYTLDLFGTELIQERLHDKYEDDEISISPDDSLLRGKKFEVHVDGYLNDKEFSRYSELFDWLSTKQAAKKSDKHQENHPTEYPYNPAPETINEDVLKDELKLELRSGQILPFNTLAVPAVMKEDFSMSIINKMDIDYTGVYFRNTDIELDPVEKNTLNTMLCEAVQDTYSTYNSALSDPNQALRDGLQSSIIDVFSTKFNDQSSLQANYKDRVIKLVKQLDPDNILKFFQNYQQSTENEATMEGIRKTFKPKVKPSPVSHNAVASAFESLWGSRNDAKIKGLLETIKKLRAKDSPLPADETKLQNSITALNTAFMDLFKTELTNKFSAINDTTTNQAEIIEAVTATLKRDIDLYTYLNRDNEVLTSTLLAQKIMPLSAISENKNQFDWNDLIVGEEEAVYKLPPNRVGLQDTYLATQPFSLPRDLHNAVNKYFSAFDPNFNSTDFLDKFSVWFNDIDIPYLSSDLSARELSYPKFKRFMNIWFTTRGENSRLGDWNQLSLEQKKAVKKIFDALTKGNITVETNEIISPPDQHSFTMPIPSVVVWDLNFDTSLEGFRNRVQLVSDGIKDFFEGLGLIFEGVWDNLDDFWNDLKDCIKKLGEGAVFGWEQFLEFLKNSGAKLGKIWNGAKDSVGAAWEKITDSAKAIWEWIVRRLDGLFGWSNDPDQNPNVNEDDISEPNEGETENDETIEDAEKLKQNETLEMSHRSFYYGQENQDYPSATARKKLDIVGKSIEYTIKEDGGNPKTDYVVLVESFCTTIATTAYNQDLSLSRSRNTTNYLQSNKFGINRSGINVETDPNAIGQADHTGENWNKTDTGRSYNEKNGGEAAGSYDKPAGQPTSEDTASNNWRNRRTVVKLFKKNESSYTELDIFKAPKEE